MIAALFAAFPQELRHILKNRRPFPFPGERDRPCELIAIETGMGLSNMETAFRRVLQKRRPDIVLSAGFGGALYEDARIGDIVWSSRALLIRDRRTQHEHLPEDVIPDSAFGRSIGEKLAERTTAREGSIVTLPEVMTKSKIKKIISGALPFPVCDMETFYLARLSHQNRVPFLGVRSISDRLNEEVPAELFAVTDRKGRYRFSNALGLLLTNPNLIRASIRLGKNAARASENLGKVVDSLVEILSAFRGE